ncbi:hypothetical protein [Acetatifactor aquisgranensis]|uniref:hypothetical protein n=1 Tax=Acetatifactor aquisgranensis TaxID=2941233 RepID=UPI00203DE0A9|nr:hypothetical protein [Acetatifactor aquisgranensis]
MAEINSLFMDAAEKEAAILGHGFLYKFLDEGRMRSNFCVLTDKRVYVRGLYLHNTYRAYRLKKGESTLDVRDIISSGFSTTRLGIVLALELLFVVLLSIATAFFLHFVEIVDHLYFGWDSIIWACSILLAVGLVAAPIYFFSTPFKIFVLEYAGGKIAFLAFDYLEDDFRTFQRELYRARDAFAPCAPRQIEAAEQAESQGPEDDKIQKL